MKFNEFLGKSIPYALIIGCIVTGYTSTSNANANIMNYKEYYNISKVGYTYSDKKRKTGSDSICNNDWITGASSHTAVLVNGDGKIRSTTERVYEGRRKVLDTSYTTGSIATKGYYYRQKHVSPKLKVVASGTFSVDDKHDF